MTTEKNYHMSPEEFRRHGHRVVDWLVEMLALCLPDRSQRIARREIQQTAAQLESDE